MIKAQRIDRELIDVRSSGDGRERVDAYFVLYRCPADTVNLDGPHDWYCRFEVPRGQRFEMQDFPSKSAARLAQGYTRK